MKKIIFILLTGQLILSGCVPSHFTMIDPAYKFKNSRIAVISGLDDKVSVYFAAALSQKLAERTTFRVMSTEEIANRVPEYPMKIHGPYSAAYFGIDEDYNNTDKNRIKKIQSKLGVDYLYVLWAPSVIQSSGGVEIHVITQLFEFPSFTEIAHAKYYSVYVQNGIVIGKAPKSVEDAADNSSEEAVRAIIEATGKGKTAK